MNIRSSVAFALSTLLLSACASNPDKMAAAYVSPLKYKGYDCDQIAMEMDYVSQRTTRLHQQLKKENKGDKWAMGIGLVLFWPALFALEGGDGPEAAEYSQLKGEFEALRQQSTLKKCGYDYSTFEKTVTASEKQRSNNPTSANANGAPPSTGSLRVIETSSPSTSIELPVSAQHCIAPIEPRPVKENPTTEELIAARKRVVDFQKQNDVYQDCLRDSYDSPGVTTFQKDALTIAHDMSVTIEESIADQFNAAYDAYQKSQ